MAVALALAACSDQPSTGPSAERGRQVYRAQCIACHDPNPSLAGPVGPPIKGSSRELLEAKLLKGTYPPGYKPQRTTAIMPPQSSLEADIPDLALFLK